MVDSIRQTDRIGIIKPPGLPRPVEDRNPSRHDRHDQGGDGNRSEHEDPIEKTVNSSMIGSGGQADATTEKEDGRQTGHRIDVRI